MTSNLIPASRVALTDPRTELPSREWYLFWYNQALLTADRQVQITALEGQITALEGQITALEGQITALGSRTTVLEADVTALEGQVTALGSRTTVLEADVAALEARVTTLEGKVAALEVAVAALDARVYTLEHLRVARAGMRKTVAQNLGTLTTTWVSIDGYSNQIYTSAIGAGYSLTTGAISVNVSNDYIYLANIEFACTADNNSSRQIEVRLLT